MRMRRITIELPEYLAEFLSHVAREMAMTESQLLTQILHMYYTVYEIGRGLASSNSKAIASQPQQQQKQTDAATDVETLIKMFKMKISRRWILNYVYIVRYFIEWLKNNNIELCKADIGNVYKFVGEYLVKRNVTPDCARNIRRVLEAFIDFLHMDICKSSV